MAMETAQAVGGLGCQDPLRSQAAR